MAELPAPQNEFLFYQTEDGGTRVQVRLAEGTVWLTQRLLAELYELSVATINHHIQNVLEDRELTPEATIRKYLIVQTEGTRQVRRAVDHYNLEMIIAVGYRVRSTRGTQFRRWATETLNEYLVKGFVLDDIRLKQGRHLGTDYFDELLERIRDIRTSERRFYQKITDIYGTSIDYDPSAEVTHTFYATVQNKLHWAIHGRTAAELIAERADSAKPHMGLTTWDRAPKGRIRKADVSVAKNYLAKAELQALNEIVTMYLDYAERQARRREPMTMNDWIERLDAFLEFNEENILTHAGRISHELAVSHAEEQYEQFRQQERLREVTEATSDFDRFVQDVKELGEGQDDGC